MGEVKYDDGRKENFGIYSYNEQLLLPLFPLADADLHTGRSAGGIHRVYRRMRGTAAPI